MRKLLLLFILCLFTLSSGAQWISQATAFAAASRGVNQIVTVNNQIAWAACYDGSGAGATNIMDYTLTTDGGATWSASTVIGPPTSYGWSCLSAVDDMNAWSLFYKTTGNQLGGGIWHTADGGNNWAQQTAFGLSSFPDVIHFWNLDTGVAIGDPVNGEYEIYTTVDGGTTWSAVGSANIPNPLASEAGLTRSFAVHKNILWFGTTKGRVYKSTDYGATWSVTTTNVSNFVDVLTFGNENHGWVEIHDGTTGDFIGLYRTMDGGSTWNELTATTGHFFMNSIGYVPYTAYALVSTGVGHTVDDVGSSYSLDGGDNWVTIDTLVQHIAVSFYDNATGWSGGFNTDQYTDGIYKYDGSFVATGIENIDPSVKFNLYPNPSNGLFYFSFETSNNHPIHIQVTDAIGKVVFDKIYKDKSQTWLRSIDMRHFSKGIYFLDLENNGNHILQKLILN